MNVEVAVVSSNVPNSVYDSVHSLAKKQYILLSAGL